MKGSDIITESDEIAELTRKLQASSNENRMHLENIQDLDKKHKTLTETVQIYRHSTHTKTAKIDELEAEITNLE